MLKRVITTIVALGILFPVLIFSNTVIFPAVFAVLTFISLFELFKCMEVHKNILMTLPLYVFGALSPFLLRYDNFVAKTEFVIICFIAGALYLVYLFSLIVWSHGKLKFNDTLTLFVMSAYIIVAYSSIIYIRDYGDCGHFLYLLVFFSAWVTDSFAYLTGYFFGRHKLIEDISPKKTIEGAIGGIVFSVLFFVGYGFVIDQFFGAEANLLFFAICGAILSVVAQIGDLIMSAIKRCYNIKDFGKIFPGHGGVLDRFDSILAVALGFCAVCMFMTLTGIKIV